MTALQPDTLGFAAFKTKTYSRFAMVLLSVTLTSLPALTTAKEAKNRGAASQETVKKKTSVKHQRSGSEESAAERDRRLFRECKGLHNAGACRGYTQR